MLLKLGVDISRLDRELRRRLPIIDHAYWKFCKTDPVITSTFEGNHSVGSLHYANRAIDVRLPDEKTGAIVKLLRGSLGPDYDVVIEQSHIHIEYDPK